MIEVNENQVYYNKDINRFCQIRKSLDNGWICSCAEFYGDARTTISVVHFSDEYIKKNFVKINNISDFAIFNEVGWSVKKQ